MKWIFLGILALPLAAFASDAVVCNVVAKGTVRCSDDGVGVAIYTFNGDGSWTKKTMVRGFERGFPKAVDVQILKNPDEWPCTRYDDESECYEVIGGNCEGRLGFFIGSILEGKRLCLRGSEYRSPFEEMGRVERVGWTECMSATHVVTRKFNPIIDMFAEMRDFDGLTPGSYCEDFAFSRELYWKP